MSKSIFYPLLGMMMLVATSGWCDSVQHPDPTVQTTFFRLVFSLFFWGTLALLVWVGARVLAPKGQAAADSVGVRVEEIGWVASAGLPLVYLILQFPWVKTLG